MAGVMSRPKELFYHPLDVCQSASGRYLYVSDAVKNVVHIFETADFSHVGELVTLAEKKGKGDNMELRAPLGMCFCATTNRLYVCDGKNNRVVVYNALN
jgi:6-phosphogluconolactonase (cycloisomerase 2 family)